VVGEDIPVTSIRPTFKPNEQIGRWTAKEGDASLGPDVRRVEDPNTAEVGVVKRARGKQQDHRARFAHEVKALEIMQTHVGVLRLLDRDPCAEPAWFVAEEATALATHLGTMPDLYSVVASVVDVAETLAAAKMKGIAHRDIKPENLFYVRGRAVVGDFGLATGHGHEGITNVGTKVGPANFNAPETMEWLVDTDPYPADVYSLAKTLWVLAWGEGKKYPNPGPLRVDDYDADLSRQVGPSADDLARLIELATAHQPTSRPSIETLLVELRVWTELHPPGSTPRPPKNQRLDPFQDVNSARALWKPGISRVVDHALQELLDCCRAARDSSRLADHPTPDPAGVASPVSVVETQPDWRPDYIAAKQLNWTGVAMVRLVAVGILTGRDTLRYRLEWQVRPIATNNWKVTWFEDRMVQVGLPSDRAGRRALADVAVINAPPQLVDHPATVETSTTTALRDLASIWAMRAVTDRKEQDAAQRRDGARELAIQQLTEIWSDLTLAAESALSGQDDVQVDQNRDGNNWFLTFGGDWRLVALVTPQGDDRTEVLLVGTIVVESSERPNNDRIHTEVANIVATDDPTGAPAWWLLRFFSNQLGTPRVEVGKSAFDGAGAAGVSAVTAHFLPRPVGIFIPPLLEKQKTELSTEGLLTLFISEVSAHESN
jgi:serine/threonine protein kinase